MNNYIVFTPNAEYRIWADSPEAAKRHVYAITCGRVSFSEMNVMRG